MTALQQPELTSDDILSFLGPNPEYSIMSVTSHVGTVPNDYSKYTPLNSTAEEIRLLRVLPSSAKSTRLSCALIRTNLRDCPSFVALSYCWGSLDDTEQITLYLDQPSRIDRSWSSRDFTTSMQSLQINPAPLPLLSTTHSPCSTTTAVTPPPIRIDNFNITANLHSALRSFLLDGRPTFLWADMLCINQGDPAERSEQVRIMDRIYARATSVLVWLGGDPTTDAGLLRDDDILLAMLFRDLSALGRISDQLVNWQFLIAEFWHEARAEVTPANEENTAAAVNGFAILLSVQEHILQGEGPSPPPQGVSEKAVVLSDFAIYYFILWVRTKFILALAEDIPQRREGMSFPRIGEYLCEHHEAAITATKAMLVPGSSVWDYVKSSIYLSNFGEYFAFENDVDRTFAEGDGDEAGGEGESALRYFEADFLRRIAEIASSTWFTRVWVLQEVAHGRDVMVRHGRRVVYWSNVTALSMAHNDIIIRARASLSGFSEKLITELLQKLGKVLPPIWSHAAAFLGRGIKDLDIYQILRQSAQLRSTDPRDKLFALYHLASGLDASKFKPDYTQDMAGVYSLFTKWLIDEDKTLRVLSFVDNTNEKRLAGLPTWAPDYGLIEELVSKAFGIDYDMRADGSERHAKALRLPNLQAHHRLALRGTHITRIRYTFTREKVIGVLNLASAEGDLGDGSLPWYHLGIPAIWALLNESYKLHVRETPDWPLTSEDCEHGDEKFSLKVLLETIMLFFPRSNLANHFVRMWRKADPDFALIEASASWRDKMRMKRWREQEALERFDERLFPHASIWMHILQRRAMFFSEEGGFGLCPETAEEGDQIVSLDGGKCLYVVRRKFADGSWQDAILAPPTWEFVGECYLRGHMNGEVPDNARLHDPLHAYPWERMWVDDENDEALALHPGRRMLYILE